MRNSRNLFWALYSVSLIAISATAHAENLESDNFDIKLVGDHELVYYDGNTGSNVDLTILRPKVPAGYFMLGHVALGNYNYIPDAAAVKNYNDLCGAVLTVLSQGVCGAAKLIRNNEHKPTYKGPGPYTIVLKPKANSPELLRKALMFVRVWNDAGSGGYMDAAFFEAICPQSYFPLGGLVSNASGAVYPDAKDVKKFRCVHIDALASAHWAGSETWNDSGSGADRDVSIWSPLYKGTAGKGEFIIPNNTATFNNAHAVPTKHKVNLVEYGDDDIYRVMGGKTEDQYNKAVTQTDYFQTRSENGKPFALKFEFNSVPNITASLSPGKQNKIELPPLSGPDGLNSKQLQSVTEIYQVPFFTITDSELDPITQWVESPQYEIVRTVKYEPFETPSDQTDCTISGADNDEYSVTFSTGLENGTSWESSLGTSISASVSGGVKPLGVGVDVAVTAEVNASFAFGGSGSTSSSSEVSLNHKVPRGTYSQAYIETSTYKVYRMTQQNGVAKRGMKITTPKSLEHKSPEVVFRDWAPKDRVAGDYCKVVEAPLPAKKVAIAAPAPEKSNNVAQGHYYAAMAYEKNLAIDEGEDGSQMDENHHFHLMHAGRTLHPGRKHFSMDRGHYLVFEGGRGDLTVYTSDDVWVWGMREHISGEGHVGKVVYQHDGNLAAYTKDGKYMWSALHEQSPAGTELRLTDEGELQIVHPDGTKHGKVAWSSKD